MTRNRACLIGLAMVGMAGMLAGFVFGEESKATKEAATIRVDGSTTVGPIVKELAAYYMKNNPGANITVSESGSGNGAKSLINGMCEVASMSRFMKDNEFKAAIDKGVYPVAHAIAVDGIAVVVHPANPVKGLKTEQVRDIYTGKITNWKQVGGPDKAIIVISRDTNSGTYECFEELALQKERMAQNVEYVGSNGAMRQRVQSTPTAIGFLGLGFTDRTVKALEINDIAPNRQTVVSGRYPIARPLFLFTNGYPTMGTHLHAFVNLYLTRKGQEIIEAIGFVPVTDY